MQYYVRYYPGWSGFRVDTVVENCWAQYRGNLTYDFNLLLGYSNPQSVFSKSSFTHNCNARWHRTFWQGDTPPEVEIRYDVPYMISTKILPYYDVGLAASESTIASAYSSWQSSPHDIMQHGIITTYFPQTGGRQEIGLYPTWAARYLLNMDNRLKEITLNCGDLSGGIPIHVRESDSARSAYTHILTIDDRPTIWIGWWDYSGTYAADRLPAPVGSMATEWTVDGSHQTSFACIPYLVTGDFFYLEEMYFWAGWDLASGNWSYRGGSTGLIIEQTRGVAWVARNVADAANMAPDVDTFEKSYFAQKINNNLASWTITYITNGNYPSVHYWEDQSNYDYDGGRPDSTLVSTCRAYTSPWMDDFLLCSLSHLQDIGFSSQNLVDWLGVSLINRFHHPDYNWYRGAPYHIPVKYDDGQGGGIRYATWADVDAAFVAQPGPTDFPDPDGVNDYRYHARAAMTHVLHLTDGSDTWDWLDSHVHSKASLLVDPTWGFLPRGYPPSDLVAPSGVTDLAASNPGYTTVDLTWTAPGDDGTAGTATSYDIRYSTYPIGSDADFAAATQITGTPAPSVGGTAESMTVIGLQAFQTYYFAIKAVDDGYNAGPLSNMAGVTTLSGTPAVQFVVTGGSGPETASPANVEVTLDNRTSNVVMVSYAVTGGTATNGTDYSLPAARTVLAALKRDAGLVSGGALASQFASLTGSDVIATTVADATAGSSANGRYMNYGTATTAGVYIFIKFDLSAYTGATVSNAQLRLRTLQGNTAMQWAAVKSHDWSEGNKSGNYPGIDPAAPGVCWAHPAGLFTTAAGYLGWGPGTNAMFDPTGNGDDLYTLTNFTSTRAALTGASPT